jgi:hypothetical protein
VSASRRQRCDLVDMPARVLWTWRGVSVQAPSSAASPTSRAACSSVMWRAGGGLASGDRRVTNSGRRRGGRATAEREASCSSEQLTRTARSPDPLAAKRSPRRSSVRIGPDRAGIDAVPFPAAQESLREERLCRGKRQRQAVCPPRHVCTDITGFPAIRCPFPSHQQRRAARFVARNKLEPLGPRSGPN